MGCRPVERREDVGYLNMSGMHLSAELARVLVGELAVVTFVPLGGVQILLRANAD